VYLGLWHFRKSLVHNRYRLFFCVWLVAQFTLLTLASSKRTVYLMALTPAAAVLAAEYAQVLLHWLKDHKPALYKRHKIVIGGVFTVLIACYLSAAFWFAPKSRQKTVLRARDEPDPGATGRRQKVALFRPNERIDGASVFYLQAYLPILQTEPELHSYLAAAPGNVALLDNTEQLTGKVTVIKEMAINRQPYYFIGQ